MKNIDPSYSKKSLFLIFILGLSLRLFLGLNYHVISPDGVYYAQIGEHIHQKHSYGILNVPGYPAIIQPPAYPFLIAITRYLLPKTYAGRVVNILLGSLLILISFYLTFYLFGEKSAYYASIIVAIHPFLIRYSIKFLTENTFLFFASVAILFAILYWYHSKHIFAVLSSVFTAIAYLTRIEGILLMVIILGVFLVKGVKNKKKLIDALIVFLIFLIIFLSYSQWVSQKLGHRVWIPKIIFARTHQLIFRHKVKEIPDFPSLSEEIQQRMVYYSLAPDGFNLWSHQLFYQIIKNPEKFKLPNINATKRKLLIEKLIRENIYNTVWIIFKRYVIPLGLLPFFLIGILRLHSKEIWKKHLWIIFSLVPFSYFLISHVEPRFLLGWSFFFVIWIAYGIAWLSEKMLQMNINRNKIITIVLIVVVMIPNLKGAVNKIQKEEKIYLITQKLKQKIPEYSNVTTSRVMHAFYNNWILFRLPWIDDGKKLKKYLVKNRIQYFILEKPRDIKYNTFYREIFEQDIHADLLELKEKYIENTIETKWYKVKNYN